MKHLLLLIALLAGTIYGTAQTTETDDYGVSINGLEFGGIYSINQFKKALGEPTRIDSSAYEWGGWDYEIIYKDELIIRFNTTPEEFNNSNIGIDFILIESPRFALNIYGQELKVGDNISKIKNMPDYTGMGKGSYENSTRIYFFDTPWADPSLEVYTSEDGTIERISFATREC